jgi:hypothetical protein
VHGYSELKLFDVKSERISNVYYKVYLEYRNITICLDIEEIESYVSFLILHNYLNAITFYYALSDYSNIIGNKISVFDTKIDEQIFKEGIRKCIKNRKKIFSSDKIGDQIVDYVYTFLNEFIKKLYIN